MNSINQRQARVAGVLILLATVTYMTGNNLLSSVISEPDTLAAVAASRTQVIVGVLLGYVCAFSVVGVAVAFYPSVAHQNQAQAVSYTATRVLECALLLVSGVAALALIPLSQNPTADNALVALLIAGNDLSYQVAMLALGVGSIPFCLLLFTRRLIPAWMALIGVVGYVALVASVIVALFGYEDLSLYLYGPGALFEIVFPLWLIVKGLALPPEPAAPVGGITLTEAASGGSA